MKTAMSLLMVPLALAATGAIRPNPPVLRMSGDRIPPCYMVFGYGTDAQGKGPYLGASGSALPIGEAPRTLEVWTFRSPVSVTRKPSGTAPHSH